MENLNEASSIDLKDSNPFADKNEIHRRSLNELTSESVEPSQAARGSLFMFVSEKDIPRLILASVLVCVSAAGTPVQTVLYGNIFTKLSDFFLGKYQSVGAFIGDIRLGCGQIIIVGAVKAVFTFMGIAMWMKFGEIQQKRARTTLSTRFFDKSMEWFDTQENLMGQLSQVNRCIEELRNGISEELGMLIQTSATIIALFVTAMYHSWPLTLVVMSTAPILAAIGWFFGKLTYNAAGLENELNAQASKVLDWSLGSGAIVRTFNGKYAEIVKFKKIIDLSARAYYRLAFATAGNAGCFKFMAFMMFVQGFWFGIYMIKLKKLHINQVFTCFTSCLMLGMQVGMISSILASMQKALAATSKIADFIIEGSKERADALYPSTCKGDIEFSDVDFKYPTRPDIVLERADFNVQPHKMNFIIGKSGSGKSTVAQLLMKFYEPTNGTIKVDGHDVASLSYKWITNNVTLIQQTPAIYKTSLKNNVALAALNRFSTLDKVPGLLVNEALKFALLDEVVSNLTDGIETEIFQDKLSGGQQQRVSIARAKIRDTPILILDEPMNALDNKNKDVLFDSIRKWRVGKTTIIISHEFAHIDNEDHVVLIDSGRVKNQGAFRDLRLEKLVQQDLSSRALTVTTESTRKRFSKFDLLKNPAILRDLEKGSTIDATDVVTEPVMGIFSILNFCSGTIGSKPLIALGLFISIVQGCSNPVFSYCFAKLLSTMVNASVGEGVSHELTQWSCIVIGLAVTIGVSQFVSQFILEYTSENWIVNLRQEAFLKINEQDMSFFNSKKNNPAELTALLMNDTRDLRNLVSGFLMLAINLVSMVLVGVVWSIVSGWKLALVGLAFVPLVFAVTGLYGKLLKSSESAYKSSVACLETHVHDSISAIRSIVVLGIEMHFKNVFVCDMELITKVGNLRSIHTAVGLALSDLCSACATGTILFYGMSLVANESYTQEQLLEVITLLTFTIASAGGLINQLPQISRGQRAGTYLIQLLKLQPSPTENEGHAIPRGLRGLRGKELVRFERVKFAYPNRPTEYVLKDVSFSISKNEKLAILGESGSGKSTVTSLLLRLYAAGDRSIYFAGTDVNQLDVEWLREKVALVPQFPKFFQGTIHENLLYGLTNTKMKSVEEIYDALKMANIYEFVISLPEGINTTIGEGSNSLISGGQLQRLSIARALLRKPEVLILDECTSSLDPENRRIILEMISNVLCKKHTVVMVTHDREMMKIADRAIVLKNGYIVEHGSYVELTEKQGELERILGAET